MKNFPPVGFAILNRKSQHERHSPSFAQIMRNNMDDIPIKKSIH